MLSYLGHELLKMHGRMHRLLTISLALLAFLAGLSLPPAGAAPSEKRLALVVGNASYKAKALATPAKTIHQS
jgi:hypothetical protein